MAAPQPPIQLLYATASGTAEETAHLLAEQLLRNSHPPVSCSSVDDYDISSLPIHASKNHIFVFLIATCGDGDVPPNMRRFWNFIRRLDLPAGVLSQLRFAMFGLGDRAYVKFNAAARMLFHRLVDLGAQAVVPIGLGDESQPGGLDTALWPWWQSFCASTIPGFDSVSSSQDSGEIIDPRISIRGIGDSMKCVGRDLWKPGTACMPFSTSESQLFDAKVLENRVLTCSQHLSDSREVRHISLSICDAPASSGFASYQPGDIVHVLPRNRQSAVSAFFSLTDFSSSQLIDVQTSSSASRFGDYHLNLRTPCSLHDLVACQLDLNAAPRRTFFARLAPFATDPREKAKLMELASPDGAELLIQYVHREKRTILIVLRDFPSARPPLVHLVDMIPVLRARAFSISSSRTGFPGELHICAAMVQYVTPLRFERVGVCSAFFKSLEKGDVVPIWLERATSLKFDESKPCVMIGPGTGVAPMRAFISGCSKGGNERHLFFGCRNSKGDFLYAKQWEQWTMNGQLTTLTTAFSREKEEKVYVQHRMMEQKDRIWDLIAKGGRVYVAGAAGSMAREVRRSIVEICEEGGRLDASKAEAFVRDMETDGRLQMECW